MTHFVGLDVSVKETSVCVVDDTGKVIWEQKVPTEPADIIALLTSLGLAYGRIGIEAGPLSQWLVNALTAADLPVICVETRHMKALLTAQQINKTDRNDARGIAQMMRVGLFKPVHVKTLAAQEQRMLLTSRKLLQRKLLDVEFRFARHAAQFRFESGRRQPLSIRAAGPRARRKLSSAGRNRRAAARRPPGHAPTARRPAQDAARHGPRRPGVPTTDDRPRGRRGGCVDLPCDGRPAATPKRYQSGEIDYDGGVSKCGDALRRTMLYEAAHSLLTHSGKWSWLKAWGMRVAQRRGIRRAIVAVARRLAVVLHRMWVDGSEFRWKKDSAAAPAVG